MTKDKRNVHSGNTQEDGKSFKIVVLVGALLLLALAVGAGYFVFGLGLPSVSGGGASKTTVPPQNAPSPVKILSNKPSGEVQKVELTASGLTYLPNPVELKVGIPVELSVSPRVSSCMATMVAEDLGIRVSSRGGPVYFIPEKAGEYPFTCWMNMGRGRFVFKE